MSYSIRCSNFFSIEKDDGYDIIWPNDLSETNRIYLENILFDQNKKNTFLFNRESLATSVNDNCFFLILDDGGVLFHLKNACHGDLCTNIEGLFIPKMYLSTAWIMIDKLAVYVLNGEFDELFESEVLYENDLDEFIEKTGHAYQLPFDISHYEVPFSFAIALVNPRIPTVEFYPCKSLADMMNISQDKRKKDDLDHDVYESDDHSITALGNTQDFVIERFHPKKGLVRNILGSASGSYTNWSMRYTGPYPMANRVEMIKFLNSGKPVRFNRITELMNNMKQFG